MTQTKISLNSPGIVVFDPEVMKAFISQQRLQSSNILQSFIDSSALGNEALQGGVLLPIYSITPWDYRIVLLESGASTVNPEWVLFESTSFVLKVTSGQVIVSDIWAILDWNADFYTNHAAHPLPENYAAAEAKVSDQLKLANGQYRVTIVGFCDRGNPDLERRDCGYELRLTQDANATFDTVGSIDAINFDVVGLPAE